MSLVCEDGEPLQPLWRRVRFDSSSDWGDWDLRLNWTCPEDVLPPFLERDLRVLTIEPLAVNQQPAGGDVLVRKPLIVFAEPAVREYHVVLFGEYGVDVRVTPVEYTWDFGDGTTLTTADPGSPYPDFDVTHLYSSLGTRTVSLTTTWTGEYRVDADPLHKWRQVDGTATTTATGEQFEVVERRSHLIPGT